MSTDTKRAADTIAEALFHLRDVMPANSEDYSLVLVSICGELSQIGSQLERIADYLEVEGGK